VNRRFSGTANSYDRVVARVPWLWGMAFYASRPRRVVRLVRTVPLAPDAAVGAAPVAGRAARRAGRVIPDVGHWKQCRGHPQQAAGDHGVSTCEHPPRLFAAGRPSGW